MVGFVCFFFCVRVCVCARCSGTSGLMDGLNTAMTHKSRSSIKVYSGRNAMLLSLSSCIKIKNKLNLLKDDETIISHTISQQLCHIQGGLCSKVQACIKYKETYSELCEHTSILYLNMFRCKLYEIHCDMYTR